MTNLVKTFLLGELVKGMGLQIVRSGVPSLGHQYRVGAA